MTSDLVGATELATHMVREWGFSAKVVGLLLERETIDGSDLAAIVGLPGPAGREPVGAQLALTMTATYANQDAPADQAPL